MSSKGPPRTAVLWCPDWPVIAAEIVDGVPAHRARSWCCTPTGCWPAREAARAEGVRRGLRKREAQGRCPQLTVRRARPGPGRAGVRAGRRRRRGARRRGGGDPARRAARWPPAGRPATSAARRRRPSGSSSTSRQACAVEGQVGIADGRVRRRCSPPGPGGSSPPGGTPGVPRRAGPSRRWTGPTWSTCCAGWACAPSATSPPCPRATCWPGSGSTRRWRTGSPPGGDERPLAVRQPPPDLDGHRGRTTSRWSGSTWPRSPPGRWPSGCTTRLAGHGLACTRLGIEARHRARARSCTGSGATTGCSTAAAIADRVRWQLDGWLTGTARRGGAPPARPTAGIDPAAAHPRRGGRHAGLQPGLWGETGRGAGAGAPGADPGAGPARPGVRVHRGARRRPRHRPTRSGWCRGATSAAPPGRASRRGRGGCPAPAPATVLPEPLPADRPRRDRRAGRGSSAPARRSPAPPATLAVGRRPAGGDRRVGRAVAGRGTVVGAGRGRRPRAVPGRRWPTARGAACVGRWRRQAGWSACDRRSVLRLIVWRGELMGWNNPPVPWSELERRPRPGSRQEPDGAWRTIVRDPIAIDHGDGGDTPAWTRKRPRYEAPELRPPRPSTVDVRRAALPLQLQLPRRGEPPGGAGRGGGPARADRAGRHRPRRLLRGGALLRGGPGAGAAHRLRRGAVPRPARPAERRARPGRARTCSLLARGPEGYARLSAGSSAEAQLAGGEKGRPVYDLEQVAADAARSTCSCSPAAARATVPRALLTDGRRRPRRGSWTG